MQEPTSGSSTTTHVVDSPPAQKQRRITKACDFCHTRAVKCRQGPGQNCSTCIEHGVPCTRFRLEQRRGVKPNKRRPANSTSDAMLQREWTIDERTHGARPIMDSLIEVYFDTIYPIVPIFDQPEFQAQWRQNILPYDQGSYSCLMAVCALSAYHAIDKAVFTLSLAPPVDLINPDIYLSEAMRAVPHDLDHCRDLNFLRTVSILALVGIQIGNNSILHKYMGIYHALLAQDGLQDEKRWPIGLSESEIEVRRRLYWTMYRFEVHTAIVTGHLIRIQESQSAVLYPTIPDHDSQNMMSSSSADGEWLTGWNLITDLYRILEYAINTFRAKRISTGFPRKLSFVPSSETGILGQIEALQADLPTRFRQAVHHFEDVRKTRCGFQVANIVVTVQLVKMTIFSSETATVRKACQVALELIEEVSAIPLDYFRVIGPPMLQELSGIGHILSSVIGKRLSEAEYQQLRSVMLRMAGFLVSLDSCIASAGEAGARIRQHVNRIDHHVASQHAQRLQEHGKELIQNQEVIDILNLDTYVTVPPDLFDNMLWDIDLSSFNSDPLIS